MKIVFCGTPEFAVPSLGKLLKDGHEVALVLTQPDRPAGRGLEVKPTPVKRLALERGLEVLQPEKIRNNEELRARLEEIRPDAIVVVAYGRIVPPWMLELPRFGCLNVHASLLPKYRGAAPIQWAVAKGESETGVSIMQLDEGLDTGGVFVRVSTAIGPETMASALFGRLAGVGAEALGGVLEGLADGTIAAAPQDDAQATLAPILKREDGRMELEARPAQVVFDRWRGFYPWPGAYGVLRGKRLLVHRMRLAIAEGMEPGVLRVVEGKLVVGAADGRGVVLEEVQMEGKPKMDGVRFAKDYQVKDGERVE